MKRLAVTILLVLLTGCNRSTYPEIAVSGGRGIATGAMPRFLVGHSATQAPLQNTNFDIDAWLDDMTAQGIPAVLVWSFMAVRQRADGSTSDPRWGYAIPVITPWRRAPAGPLANDGLPRWDLSTFDDDRYWPRLQRLLDGTAERGLLLWITMFDGWAKEGTDIPYHPFRSENGGPLEAGADFVHLAQYGQEIPGPYDPNWPWRARNQWYQEQFADRLARLVNSYDHVVLELFNEGEWYDQEALLAHQRHFLAFLRRRTTVPLALNADHLRVPGWDAWNEPGIDIVSWHTWEYDFDATHRRWLEGAARSPARPLVNSETVPAYVGAATGPSTDAIRRVLWVTLLAQGHVFVQDDAAFEYDPHAPPHGGAQLREQLGHAARFFSPMRVPPDSTVPCPTLTRPPYCLHQGDSRIIVYSPEGGVIEFVQPLSHQYLATWYDPRSGDSTVAAAQGGYPLRFRPPTRDDWVLHLERYP